MGSRVAVASDPHNIAGIFVRPHAVYKFPGFGSVTGCGQALTAGSFVGDADPALALIDKRITAVHRQWRTISISFGYGHASERNAS
jgi:hypothetical protein